MVGPEKDTPNYIYYPITTNAKIIKVKPEKDNESTNSCLYFYVISVNFLAFACGNSIAWSSTGLILLKSTDVEKNPLGHPVTLTEESWIVSLINLGAACGPVFAGFCSDKFGRKKTLLLFSVPMLMSHMISAYASTAIEFYVSRFISGLGIGCVFTIIPIYVGEIAKTEIRGLLGSIMGIFISLGLLFVFTVGPFINLSTLSFILMVPIGIFLITTGVFVPESPYYYVSLGNEISAKHNLKRLGKNIEELDSLKEFVQESKTNNLSLYQMSKAKSFIKGIAITIILMILQQFIGISIMLSYMETIFIASGSSISSSTSTNIVAVIQLCAVLMSSLLIDRWGRKLLLIISSAGCSLPLLSLAVFFYMKNNEIDVLSLGWLPVFSVILFFIFFNLGMATLPWILVGELFSTKTKSFASTITATTCLTAAFISTLILPKLAELVGFQGIFSFCAVSALTCSIFVLWYIPETKNKSFQDILTILEE